MPRLRLQKFLAAAGVDSRRHCEALIQAGHVAVNGAVVTELGSSVDPEQDTVVLDGKPLQLRQTDTYLLLHKPEGYVTTAHDERGRPTVMDLLPNASGVRLFPVGRLDQDTAGALLFTNNGELAHRLTHPSYGIEREYEALLRGTPIADGLRRLQRGAAVEGAPCRAGAGASHQARSPGARRAVLLGAHGTGRRPEAGDPRAMRGCGLPGAPAEAGPLRAAPLNQARARHLPAADSARGGRAQRSGRLGNKGT